MSERVKVSVMPFWCVFIFIYRTILLIGINRNKAWGKHTKHQYSGIENTQSVGYKS